MKVPTKIQEKLLRNGESTITMISGEARKINEIIDYLEQCEQNVLLSNNPCPPTTP